MTNFEFSMRTQIIFERGCVEKAGEAAVSLGAKKVMLAADKGIRATGLTDRIKKSLEEQQIAITDFDNIVPNPRIMACEEGAAIGMTEGIDAIIAVGGGSSIDTAKAIAGMIGHGTTDFEEIKYPKPYTKDALPLIAIPTTAGTGSEVTPTAIITDTATHNKVLTLDNRCAPDIALCDPSTLMGLPRAMAAATGLDALTHAIEGYVASCTSPITEAFGLYAIRVLAENLRPYIFQRTEDVCDSIMLGSTMAGLCFGYADTGSVHSLSEVIGGKYDTPHGVANAVFLADVTEFSIPAAVEKYARVAEAMGVKSETLSRYETAIAGVREIRALTKDLDIPAFSQLPKVDPKDFEMFAERCVTHISNQHNPIQMMKEDFLFILNQAYER